MLHIILMILKILGILILSILGLGLCIGLLILLCPIRYYVEGSIYGKPEGKIRISWLLRLVCTTISYRENRAECKICILGIRLKRRKKEKKEDSENIDSEKAKKRFSFFKKWKRNPITGKKKVEKEDEQTERIEEELEAKEVQQTKEEEKEEKKEEIKIQQVQADREEGKVQEDKEEVQPKEIKTEQNIQEETAERKQPVLERVVVKIREILEKVKNILAKIKGIPAKIKSIPAKVHDILSAVKEKIQKFLELLRNLNKKKQAVLAFIKDEKNKEAFRYTKGKLFRILFHILPGRVTLKLHYGFEDPAATGMLTGMIFMFYPRSAEQFQLTPDFEKRVLEGELTLKGRVQLIRVLWNLFSIYSHKECNRIIKMMLKKLKTR